MNDAAVNSFRVTQHHDVVLLLVVWLKNLSQANTLQQSRGGFNVLSKSELAMAF